MVIMLVGGLVGEWSNRSTIDYVIGAVIFLCCLFLIGQIIEFINVRVVISENEIHHRGMLRKHRVYPLSCITYEAHPRFRTDIYFNGKRVFIVGARGMKNFESFTTAIKENCKAEKQDTEE